VRDSARSRPFEFDLVAAWSMPWSKLAELIYPNILGHISIRRVMWYWGGGLYPGMGSPFLFSVYVGLLAVALTIGGAFARPRGGRLVFLLCFFSVVLALGNHTPLLKFLYDTGIATTIRYPEKFAMIGVFAIIVFSAQMLDRMLAGDAIVRDGAIGFSVATTAVAATLAIVAFTPLYSRTFMRIWGLTAGAGATRMTGLSRQDWIIAAVRGVIVVGLLVAACRIPHRIWIVVAGLFVAADLAWVTAELNPRQPRRFFQPPPISAEFPPNRAAFRVFHEADWYGTEEIARQFFSTGDAVYWVVRNGLFPMTPAGSKLRTVIERDYDKTALLPTVDLADSVWDVKRSGRGDWWEPFMAMSNAWYRGVYRNFDEERKRARGDFKRSLPVRFIETTHYPRYYFADQVVTIRDRQDFVTKLSNESFSKSVAFVGQPSFVPARGTVRAVSESANRAVLDVESLGQGFLVMSVTPHKYWHITVDGRPVPAVVTNIAYQGVIVTPGRHRVVMEYRNELVHVGLLISIILILILIAIALLQQPRAGTPSVEAYEEPVHVVPDASGTHAEPAMP